MSSRQNVLMIFRDMHMHICFIVRGLNKKIVQTTPIRNEYKWL